MTNFSYFLFAVLLLTTILPIKKVVAHSLMEDKQFPEDREYIPRIDTGFAQFQAPSLHNTQKIVLTYDDGPHPTRTPKLLNLLKQYNVKATFFVLGENINRNTKPIIERILNEGHILANHDWDHDNNNRETREEFNEELEDSILQLESIAREINIPYREKYFRFPYAAYGYSRTYHHLNILRELSYKLYNDNCINFVFWDIDTADWVSNMTPLNILQTFKANIFGGKAYDFKKITNSNGRTRYVKKEYTINNPIGGGVVLMHDIHARSIEATKLILEFAKHHNIEFISLKDVDEFYYDSQKICSLL